MFEYQSWAKALAILTRSNEGLDHFGLLVVAVELIELREPEAVAVKICVRRVVWIPPQVAEILHQHERPVELRADEIHVLGHRAQNFGPRLRSSHQVSRQLIALCRRERAARVLVELSKLQKAIFVPSGDQVGDRSYLDSVSLR